MGFLSKYRKKQQLIKVGEIKDYIFTEILLVFPEFHFLKSKNELIRKTEYGRDTIDIRINSKSWGGAVVQVFVFKRFDEVETSLNGIPTDYVEFSTKFDTIGGPVSRILGKNTDNMDKFKAGPRSTFILANRYDLEKFTIKIIHLLKECELKFFKINNSISELVKLINVDLRNTTVFTFNYSLKIKKGLIIAWLAKNEKFNEIKEIYLDELHKCNPESLPMINEVIELIELKSKAT